MKPQSYYHRKRGRFLDNTGRASCIRRRLRVERLEDRQLLSISPLLPSGPSGSLVYDWGDTESIGVSGEIDSFTVDLDANQSLTVAVDPDASLQPVIVVFDPSGALLGLSTAPTVGEDALLQTLEVSATGTYRINVGGASGSSGNYAIQMLLNAAVEEDKHGGPDNGNPASAQDISGSFLPLGDGAGERAAVLSSLSVTPGVDPSLVFSEGFESGALSASWTTYSSDANGRIRLDGSFGAADGSNALLMDTHQANPYSLNEAICTIDLSGLTDAELSFQHADWGDEPDALPSTFIGHHEGDGIAISDDGVNWHTVFGTPGQPFGQWVQYTVDLAAEAAAAGMTLGANFQIKFQQYDNYSLDLDGRGWDEITVHASKSVDDWYSFSLHDGQSASIVLDGTGLDEFDLTLYDDAGNTLASGVPGENVSRIVDNFVDAGNDGFARTYYARVAGNVPADYCLVVTRDMNFDLEPNNDAAAPQEIAPGIAVLGHVGGEGDALGDYFTIPVVAGDVLTITTTTPASGSGLFVNLLDPLVEIYSPGGDLAAQDDNGGGDGRNAALVHTAAESGNYVVRVAAAGVEGGEYVLDVDGYSGSPSSLAVVDSSLADGAALDYVPDQVTIVFSDEFRPTTLSADDLKVDGMAASGYSLVDSRTVVFDLPELAEGEHQLSLAGGSMLDLQATPLSEFIASFRIDSSGPRVVASSLLGGGHVAPGDLVVTVQFDETLDETGIDVFDLPLDGFSGGSRYADSLSYDPTESILTATFLNLPEDSYELTFISGDGAFEDPLGNDLDGEPMVVATIPSGDGQPGGDFVLSFGVSDLETAPFPAAFDFVAPLAADVMEGSTSDWIWAARDTDSFTVSLTPNQTLSVVVDPSGTLQPSIEVFDASDVLVGNASASAPGEGALVRAVDGESGGSHTIRIGGVGDTTGGYTVKLVLNATIDSDAGDSGPSGGPTNDELASAQDMDAAFKPYSPVLSDAAGWYHQEFDVSALAGQTLRLQLSEFISSTFASPGLIEFDDISLVRSGTSTNLLTNGGFETGDFSGWTALSNGLAELTPWTVGPAGGGFFFDSIPLEGTHSAYNGFDGEAGLQYDLYQDVSIPADGIYVLGVNYRISHGPLGDAGGRALEIAVRDPGGGVLETLYHGSGAGFNNGSARSAAVGKLDWTDDWYRFSLRDGQTASIALATPIAGATSVELYDSAGNMLSFRSSPDELQQVIDGFVDITDDGLPETYYVRVPAGEASDYGLLVTRGADFDAEMDDPAVQDITSSGSVLGHLGAEQWSFDEKILGSQTYTKDHYTGDAFGYAAAIDGDWAVIRSAWSLYFYHNEGGSWVEKQVIDASYNGGQMALDGNTFVISSPWDNTKDYDAGIVAVFRHDGDQWAWHKNIFDPVPTYRGFFGRSVDIDGDTIAVGADKAAHVFSYNGSDWVWKKKFTATLPAEDNRYGQAIAVDGDKMLVGAWTNDGNAEGSGLVYAYQFDGTNWTGGQAFSPADISPGAKFGISVDIQGNLAIIGAPREEAVAYNSGAVYVYEFNGAEWVEKQRLTSAGQESRTYFGGTVRIDQDTLVSSSSLDGGSILIFELHGDRWIWQDILTTPSGDDSDGFPSSIALSGGVLLGGATGDDQYGQDCGAAYAFNRPTTEDKFSINASVGDLLTIGTTTPGSPRPLSENLLDPVVELFDPSGTLVAVDDNGADDGRNTQLTYTAETSGKYTIRVTSADNSKGTYALRAEGFTGELDPFTIDGTDLPDGSALDNGPGEITVTFNDPIRLSTLQAGDLTVGGMAATAVTVVDRQTATFTLPELPDGLHQVAVDAGSILDLQGTSVEAFSSTFSLDTHGPRVAASSISNGDLVSAGNLAFALQFDEPLDVSCLGPEDVSLVGLLGGSHVPRIFSYDPARLTLDIQYAGLPDDSYELTLLSGDGHFEDLLGNDLDGEINLATTTPSGDDVTGGDFVLSFSADGVTFQALTTQAVEPLGSMIRRGSAHGEIQTAGDTDSFTVDLAAGQTLSMVVTPGAATLRPTVELTDGAGHSLAIVSAGETGGAAFLQAVPISATGVYEIVVGADAGTMGGYSLEVTLNAVMESEWFGGMANDLFATAEDIDGSFASLGAGSAQRGAAIGSAPEWLAYRLSDAFVESFEDGVLGAGWSTYSSNSNGRIRVENAYGAASGGYALLMDTQVVDSPTLNEAIVTLELFDPTLAELSFHHADWDDEPDSLPGSFTGHHDGDGIAISEDGVNWHTVFTPSVQSPEVWQEYTIDLAAEAAAAGITLGSNFQIKFQQYDNYPLIDDGRGYDEISVRVSSPVDDWYDFSLADGQSATVLLDTANPAILELHDAAGNLLALGSEVSGSLADGSRWIIEDFVDQTMDGVPEQYFIRVVAAIGDEYSLIVTRDAGLDIEPNDGMPPAAQDMPISGRVLGHLGDTSHGTDYYRFEALVGDVLTISTSAHGDFAGDLDPTVMLYGPDGLFIAKDDNGAVDGRNVLLNHEVSVSGTYTVKLAAVDETVGEYVLRLNGNSAPADTFSVVDADPLDQGALAYAPGQATFVFDELIDLRTVQPSDLMIDGVPVASAVQSDGRTVVFDLPPLADGTHEAFIAAGTIVDLQGTPLEPFAATFAIDGQSPRVISSSVLEGDVVSAGLLTCTIEFDEELDATGFDASDVTLTGTLGGPQTVDVFSYDAGTSTLTVEFSGIADDSYVLRLHNADGQFADLAGNVLDGEAEPNATIPSGDGTLGGDFAVRFTADAAASPVPLGTVPPGGSLVYRGEMDGFVQADSDVDNYTLEMSLGEGLSLAVDPAGGLATTVEVFDPLGQLRFSASPGEGQGTFLRNLTAEVAGEYTIAIGAADQTDGTYSASVLLNAVWENESGGGGSNDGIASAENLDDAIVPVEYAPHANTDWDSQRFNISSYAGQTVRIQLSQLISANFASPAIIEFDGISLADMDTETELLVNGGFETGDFSGWTATSNGLVELTPWTVGPAGGGFFFDSSPLDGTYSAYNGFDGQAGLRYDLYQDVSIPSGGNYALTVNYRIKHADMHLDPNDRTLEIALRDTAGTLLETLYEGNGTSGHRSAERGAVHGSLGSFTEDWYSFQLADGRSTTLALSTSSSGAANIELFDAAGTLLAMGISADNAGQIISGFSDTTSDGTADMYYARVSGSTVSEYTLVVLRDGVFEIETNDDLSSPASYLQQGVCMLGAVEGGLEADRDHHAVEVNAGDSLLISTVTPRDEAGGFANLLDPLLELYDPGGTLVAIDDNGGADGRNAKLDHTATQSGTYTVRVSGASDTAGEYMLSVTGQSGMLQPGQVVGSDIPEGAKLNATPEQVVIEFSAAVLPGSLDPGDLLVDGKSALSVELSEGNKAVFQLPSLFNGNHTFSMSQGAVLDSRGVPFSAFSSSFATDTAAPFVLSYSPSSTIAVPAGDVDCTIRFNEAMNTDNLDVSDALLEGRFSGAYAASEIAYDSNTHTVTVRYDALPEDQYTLTLRSGVDGVQDAAGNDINGGDFTMSFFVDNSVAAFPVPLANDRPLGNMTYRGSIEGRINASGDTDRFTLDLDAGQTLALIVDPSTSLRADTRLYDPQGILLGHADSASAGRAAVLQTIDIATAGTYLIEVSSIEGSTGAYTVEAVLNAIVENERFGGHANDDMASAEDIEVAFINIGSSPSATAQRGAVVGAFPGTLAEDFETGELGENWTTYASYLPERIRIIGEFGTGGGDYALMMDTTGASTNSTEAIWNVDLLGADAAELSFSYACWDRSSYYMADEFRYHDYGTGVAISDDGINWHTIFRFVQTNGQWQEHGLDLVAAASDAGVSLGPELLIKFQATSGRSLPERGAGYDNISIDYSGMYQDWYRFHLADGQSASLTVQTSQPGSATLELYDANGNFLVAGQAGETFDGVIHDFGDTTDNGIADAYYALISGVPNTEYSLTVTRSMELDGEPNVDGASDARDIASTGIVLGDIGGPSLPTADYHAIYVGAGDTLRLITTTPGDDPIGEFDNVLDPELSLYDPGGILVAVDDNGAADGRNSLLEYTATEAGRYVVCVSAEGETTGQYVLEVLGAEGSPPALAVSPGGLSGSLPTATDPPRITVVFSQPLAAVSLNAEDLTLDGVAATSVALSAPNTAVFTLAPGLLAGRHTVEIAEDAVFSSHGRPIEAYSESLLFDDSLAPTVQHVLVRGTSWSDEQLDAIDAQGMGHPSIARLGYLLPDGVDQSASLPWTGLDTLTIAFSEEVAVDAEDLILSGSGDGPAAPDPVSLDQPAPHIASWRFDAPLEGNKYLIEVFDDVRDAIGNPLDGEWLDGTTTFPSGDGNSGGDYRFRMNVLPGDGNQDGTVDMSDDALLRVALFSFADEARFVPALDFNGSGMINVRDGLALHRVLSSSLPHAEPVASALAGGMETLAIKVLAAMGEEPSGLTARDLTPEPSTDAREDLFGDLGRLAPHWFQDDPALPASLAGPGIAEEGRLRMVFPSLEARFGAVDSRPPGFVGPLRQEEARASALLQLSDELEEAIPTSLAIEPLDESDGSRPVHGPLEFGETSRRSLVDKVFETTDYPAHPSKRTGE